MTPQEYFRDWSRVIDFNELIVVLDKLSTVNPELLCPNPNNVFKAFRKCQYKDLKVLFLGQDPYPQKNIATGIAFGNSRDTPDNLLSPSLQVLKESCINPELPHGPIDFDITLESWAEQGVLMLNSALTCEVNNIGSHTMLWRKFISNLLKEISSRNNGIIFVLLGAQAQTFEPYISSMYHHIIKVEHPSYFARTNTIMPYSIFTDINKVLRESYGETIKWFTEY